MNSSIREFVLETKGENEATACKGMASFAQEDMGRVPKDIHSYMNAELRIVHMQGVLTAAEKHLVKTLLPEDGRDLLKQVRVQLIETASPTLQAMVQDNSGVKPVSSHHGINTDSTN